MLAKPADHRIGQCLVRRMADLQQIGPRPQLAPGGLQAGNLAQPRQGRQGRMFEANPNPRGIPHIQEGLGGRSCFGVGLLRQAVIARPLPVRPFPGKPIGSRLRRRPAVRVPWLPPGPSSTGAIPRWAPAIRPRAAGTRHNGAAALATGPSGGPCWCNRRRHRIAAPATPRVVPPGTAGRQRATLPRPGASVPPRWPLWRSKRPPRSESPSLFGATVPGDTVAPHPCSVCWP